MIKFFSLLLIIGLLKPALSKNYSFSPENLSISRAPFVVSVRNVYGEHICGAAIVKPEFVLGAANCAVQHAEYIVAGADKVDYTDDENIQTSRIYFYDLNVGFRNDIYVILYYLDHPLVYSPIIQPIPIYGMTPYDMSAMIVGFVEYEGEKRIRLSGVSIESEKCRSLAYDIREAWRLTCALAEKKGMCSALERSSLLTCWNRYNEREELCGLYLHFVENQQLICEDETISETQKVISQFAMSFVFESWVKDRIGW